MSKLLKTKEGAENLPSDCLQSIFNYLSENDLKTVSLVCKDFLTNVNLCKQSLKVVHPKVSLLSAHLKRFTALKRIDLTYGDIGEAILEIAQSGSMAKNLKVLNFHSLNRLRDNDLVLIANSFMKEELKICYCSKFHYLEGILDEISSSQFPTDYGIEFFTSKLKLLKKISLSGKHIISDRSLIALSLSCVFLKDVSIFCSRGLTENGIGLLLRNRPNLEALSIGYVKMNGSQSTITIENSISHAKALTSLEFFSMEFSDKLLKAIAKAKLPLKKLGLKYCYNFTVMSLPMVLANYQLAELHIVERIPDRDMNFLVNGDVSKLTHLDISLCRMKKATLLLLAVKCPLLEDITISFDTERHEQVLDKLGFLFPNLRVLDLNLVCELITSKGIKAILKSCKFLKKLILRAVNEEFIELDDSELPELNLEELGLTTSGIGNEWLARIAKICPRLVSLDLSYSYKLTVEGVKQIVRNITTLNCLYIRRNDRIDVGDLLDWMLSTGNLASLRRIYVGGYCYISEKQRDEFLQQGCLLLQW